MASCYKSKDEFEWSLDFGKNLQNTLRSKNISQQHLALGLGSTNAMVSRYIHGTAVPSVYKVCQIANIIGCDVSDLIKSKYTD